MSFSPPRRFEEVSLKVAGQIELHPLAVTVLEEARVHTKAQHLWFVVRRKSGMTIEAELAADGHEVQKRSLPLSAAPAHVRTVVDVAIRENTNLVVDSTAGDDRFASLPAFQDTPAALLTVPVTMPGAPGKVLAVLHMSRDAGDGCFDAEDVQFLTRLAPNLGVSVLNALKVGLYIKKIEQQQKQLRESEQASPRCERCGAPTDENGTSATPYPKLPTDDGNATLSPAEIAHFIERGKDARKVLHDLGNHLNGAVLASEEVVEMLSESRLLQVQKAFEIIKEEGDNLSNFFRDDPRAKLWPEYTARALDGLTSEYETMHGDIQGVVKYLQIMKEIIYDYQSRAINSDMGQS
ncbi:GAF domain-containing protein [Acanthopleuribacter pedis]|uniref:GAF domain-containing protein n=1 Tax=Acanthopleuribacter pedis TaxID=442870 RepID=A0A8J7Q4R0_9BACT|nr:GAF domain-containing protein [Acanthopleuribacter pedis]MBO1317776.1 GAF domain-containing protein [Acanthopleuribacter pedis]